MRHRRIQIPYLHIMSVWKANKKPTFTVYFFVQKKRTFLCGNVRHEKNTHQVKLLCVYSLDNGKVTVYLFRALDAHLIRFLCSHFSLTVCECLYFDVWIGWDRIEWSSRCIGGPQRHEYKNRNIVLTIAHTVQSVSQPARHNMINV